MGITFVNFRKAILRSNILLLTFRFDPDLTFAAIFLTQNRNIDIFGRRAGARLAGHLSVQIG